MNRKTLVLLSGGMDSTTAIAKYTAMRHEVSAVGFNYGQRHSKELEAAKAVAEFYNIDLTILDLTGAAAAFAGSALTGGGEVPLGHYEDESMKKTVVPNRNMIMLSLAAGLAISRGMGRVVYAAHAGDHAIYPDCRPEFLHAVDLAVNLGNYDGPLLEAPFIDMTKADIAFFGYQLNAPLHLSWSCYKGEEYHCGQCGTCVERREAFDVASIADPTIYQSPAGATPPDQK